MWLINCCFKPEYESAAAEVEHVYDEQHEPGLEGHHLAAAAESAAAAAVVDLVLDTLVRPSAVKQIMKHK